MVAKDEMLTETDVDVLLPCRNAPGVLWLALTHLMCHNRPRSVTLLDNVSDAPGMPEVFAWARARGALMIRHERNVGVWASANRGLAVARSRYVLLLSSDLLLGPGAIAKLIAAAQRTGFPLVGPEVVVEAPSGIQQGHLLISSATQLHVLEGLYNGSCWLLDWPRLRKSVGWFDERFFVCFGDTDFIERMRRTGERFGVVNGVPSIHLDKCSRRADYTEEQDTSVEMTDAAAFAAKWAEYPDVLTRHGQHSSLQYMLSKGNWDERISV